MSSQMNYSLNLARFETKIEKTQLPCNKEKYLRHGRFPRNRPFLINVNQSFLSIYLCKSYSLLVIHFENKTEFKMVKKKLNRSVYQSCTPLFVHFK